MSTNSPLIRVCLISDVLPSPSGAGQSLLHRHLTNNPHVFVVIPQTSLVVAFFKRVSRKLAATLFPGLDTLLLSLLPSSLFCDIESIVNSDIVMTVAHGHLYEQAHQLSIRYKKPLVIFHHDLWSHTTTSLASVQKVLHKRLKYISSNASLNLAISSGMKRIIGSTNTLILPPIADPNEPPVKRDQELSSSFNIIYAGNLDSYSSMLCQFSSSLRSTQSGRLFIAGRSQYWLDNWLPRHSPDDIYLGAISNEELLAHYNTMSAALVPLSFNPKHKMLVSTSFPSKLTELSKSRLPIILWAPQYSAAYQTLNKYHAAILCTSPSPEHLIQLIRDSLSNEQLLLDMSNNAFQMYQDLFEYQRCQSLFNEALKRIV